MVDLQVMNTQGNKACMIVRTVLCEALEFKVSRSNGATVIHVSPAVSAKRIGEIVAHELAQEENYPAVCG